MPPQESIQIRAVHARSPGGLGNAAMTRTSTGLYVFDPIRRTSRASRARSNLGCKSIGNSPTSSRKSVPPDASSKAPTRRSTAPVNEPFSCPNNSLSSKLPCQVANAHADLIDDNLAMKTRYRGILHYEVVAHMGSNGTTIGRGLPGQTSRGSFDDRQAEATNAFGCRTKLCIG